MTLLQIQENHQEVHLPKALELNGLVTLSKGIKVSCIGYPKDRSEVITAPGHVEAINEPQTGECCIALQGEKLSEAARQGMSGGVIVNELGQVLAVINEIVPEQIVYGFPMTPTLTHQIANFVELFSYQYSDYPRLSPSAVIDPRKLGTSLDRRIKKLMDNRFLQSFNRLQCRNGPRELLKIFARESLRRGTTDLTYEELIGILDDVLTQGEQPPPWWPFVQSSLSEGHMVTKPERAEALVNELISSGLLEVIE